MVSIRETSIKTHLLSVNDIFNIIILIILLFISWICYNVFLFASFQINTESMTPSILPRDKVVVLKPLIGARLFDFFSLLGGEDVEIFRIPGISTIKRNDVLVFNYPYYYGIDKIKMQLEKYYVKRCIGLPKDTIFIKNKKYTIKKRQNELIKINHTYSSRSIQISTDSIYSFFKNSIEEFGPLIIPYKNKEILIDRNNYVLYKTLIEWETSKKLHFNEQINQYYIENQSITKYKFKYDYFFVIGDNLKKSEDSRYWGLVPEPFIVGRVYFIIKSNNSKGTTIQRIRNSL